MKKTAVSIFIAVLLLFISHSGFSQCRNIAKKCLPELAPYIYTGQLNTAEMAEGETAELGITFYSGQEYRIIICSSSVLGDIRFNILDKDRKLVFANKDHNNARSWDFKVNSTEEYTIEIIVPAGKGKTSGIANMGCVAILTGFKKP